MPGVPEAAWRQVSVSAQECIGAQRCPFGSRCFAERAREAAAKAHIVVTNHALLAIDATSDLDVLPEHDVVIIDEAHDLVDRVTSATTGELSVPAVDAAARRAARLIESAAQGGAPAVADRLRQAAAALTLDLGDAPRGPDGRAVRRAGRDAALGAGRGRARAPRRSGPARQSERRRPGRGWRRPGSTLSSLDELQRTASRILDAFGERITDRAGGGLARPAVRRGRAAAAHAAGGAARGRPGAAGPPVRRAHGGADLGHARPRRLVRPAGQPVGA